MSLFGNARSYLTVVIALCARMGRAELSRCLSIVHQDARHYAAQRHTHKDALAMRALAIEQPRAELVVCSEHLLVARSPVHHTGCFCVVRDHNDISDRRSRSSGCSRMRFRGRELWWLRRVFASSILLLLSLLLLLLLTLCMLLKLFLHMLLLLLLLRSWRGRRCVRPCHRAQVLRLSRMPLQWHTDGSSPTDHRLGRQSVACVRCRQTCGSMSLKRRCRATIELVRQIAGATA